MTDPTTQTGPLHSGGTEHESHAHQHDDEWTGEKYWSWPGVREMAVKSAETVEWALRRAGVEDLKELHGLEVGAGGGAVTPHLSNLFSTVHSIDVSPSLLSSLPQHLPEDCTNVTYSLHTLTPSSSAEFEGKSPQPSPTQFEPERKIAPPRARWDVGVVAMVMHHVDDVAGFMEGLVGVLEVGGWVVVIEILFPEEGKEWSGDDGHGHGHGHGQHHGEVQAHRRDHDHAPAPETTGHSHAASIQDHHRLVSDQRVGNLDSKTTASGSVNAPNHFHRLTPPRLHRLLSHWLEDVQVEMCGEYPPFGPAKVSVPCFVGWGRKGKAATNTASRAQSHHNDRNHGPEPAHGHGHGHGLGEDTWDGAAYLARPGVQETAQISFDSVVHALHGAGVTDDDMKSMNVLEIGSGPGPVTAHLLPAFPSVHAIDTSPSMLLSLSTLLPSLSHPTLSHSLHFLSPSSPTDFTTPLFSPIPSEPERKLIPPCREFDLAIANLVAHHVDDLDGWMEGAVGLLRKGGWLIVTEFGKEEGGKDVAGEVRTEKDKERQEGLQRVKAGANAEAGEAGEAGEASLPLRTLPSGSVNAPGHHHPSFTPSQLSSLFAQHGLVDVHAEIRGTLPVWPDKAHPPCLIVRGRKG